MYILRYSEPWAKFKSPEGWLSNFANTFDEMEYLCGTLGMLTECCWMNHENWLSCVFFVNMRKGCGINIVRQLGSAEYLLRLPRRYRILINNNNFYFVRFLNNWFICLLNAITEVIHHFSLINLPPSPEAQIMALTFVWPSSKSKTWLLSSVFPLI